MGLINRIAAKTASKKAKRISWEERRRKVIAERKAKRRTVKEYAKESARPYLTKTGRRKLKIDSTPVKYKRVKKGKKYIKVKIKSASKPRSNVSFKQRTGFTINN